MKRVKVLGSSNDIGVPSVELDVAKLVQNAKAHGLKWTKGAFYRNSNGKWISDSDSINRVSCCAIGAAKLEEDTADLSISAGANDGGYAYYKNMQAGTYLQNSQLLGLGFRLAMR